MLNDESYMTRAARAPEIASGGCGVGVLPYIYIAILVCAVPKGMVFQPLWS